MLDIQIFRGLDLPRSVGQLRYRKFIAAQGKAYRGADHARATLVEPLDALSSHLVARSPDGRVLAALRLSPLSGASVRDLVPDPMLRVADDHHCDLVLSRLVRAGGLDATKAVRPLFRHCFDHCLSIGQTRGILNTAPRLLPLFAKYGWVEAGPAFDDPVAGTQLPLFLDAADHDRLRAIGSPYLEPRRELIA